MNDYTKQVEKQNEALQAKLAKAEGIIEVFRTIPLTMFQEQLKADSKKLKSFQRELERVIENDSHLVAGNARFLLMSIMTKIFGAYDNGENK